MIGTKSPKKNQQSTVNPCLIFFTLMQYEFNIFIYLYLHFRENGNCKVEKC